MTEQERQNGIKALAALNEKFIASASRKNKSSAPKEAADVLALIEYTKALQKENEQLRFPSSIH